MYLTVQYIGAGAGAVEMTHQVKAFAMKTDNQSLILGSHEGRKDWLLRGFSYPFYALCSMRAHGSHTICTHVHSRNNKQRF